MALIRRRLQTRLVRPHRASPRAEFQVDRRRHLRAAEFRAADPLDPGRHRPRGRRDAACVLAWWERESAFGRDGWRGRRCAATPLADYREVFAITAAVCLVSFHTFGLYSPSKSLLNVEEYKAVTEVERRLLLRGARPALLPARATLPQVATGRIYAPLLWLHSASSSWRWSPTSSHGDAAARVRAHPRDDDHEPLCVVPRDPAPAPARDREPQRPRHRRRLDRAQAAGEVPARPDARAELRRVRGRRPELWGAGSDAARCSARPTTSGRVLAERKVGEVFISLPETNESKIMTLCAELDALGARTTWCRASTT